MVRSWSTQVSPQLQTIHRQLTLFNTHPENEALFDSLISTLLRIPGAWMSEEAMESGVMDSILSLLKYTSTRQRRNILCSILKELLIVRTSMPDRISNRLLGFVQSCFQEGKQPSDKDIKCIKKTITTHTAIFSPSSLLSLLSFYYYLPDVFIPFLDEQMDKQIKYVFTQKSHSQELLPNSPCKCSNCLTHPTDSTFSKFLVESQANQLITIWKNCIRQLPLSHSHSILQTALQRILNAIQKQTHFRNNILVVEIVHSCCHVLGPNSLLDTIEHLWNGKLSSHRLELLSALVAHSPLLSLPDVLHVLLSMMNEARPGAALINLILHCLVIRLGSVERTLEQTLSPLLQQVVRWCDEVDRTIWETIPCQLRHASGVLLSRYALDIGPLCCSRWCFHLCQGCCSLIIIPYCVSCVICSSHYQTGSMLSLPPTSTLSSPRSSSSSSLSSSSSSRLVQCSWSPPESVHICPHCHSNCCRSISTCLCQAGSYPRSYDYSDSDSDSDSNSDSNNEYEHTLNPTQTKYHPNLTTTTTTTTTTNCRHYDCDRDTMVSYKTKRQRVVDLQQLISRSTETAEAFFRLGGDIFLQTMSFLPVQDLLHIGECTRNMKELAENEWLWKRHYFGLFYGYHCTHGKQYKHKYYQLYKKRIHVMRAMGEKKYICQVCGCNRHFNSISLLNEHIINNHNYEMV